MKNNKILLIPLVAMMCSCNMFQNNSSSSTSDNKTSTPSKTSTSSSIIESSSSSSSSVILDVELKVKSFDVEEVKGLNKKIMIPDYSATDKYGNDITDLVEITDSLLSNIDLEKKVITFLEHGEHNIVFSVTDPNDSSLTKSKSFKINCYRELFNYNNMHSNGEGDLNEDAPNDEQYIISHNNDKGLARFNMEASKLYYAEASFDGSVDKNVGKGLSHVVSTDNDDGAPLNIWVTSMINVDTQEYVLFSSRSYSWTEIKRVSLSTLDIDSLDITNGFKLAIARYGNEMYTFLNDTLIDTFESEVLTNIDTTPGLYTYMGDAFEEIVVKNEEGEDETVRKNLYAENGVKITNIDYFDNVKAFKKLENLGVEELKESILEISDKNVAVELNKEIKLPTIIAYNKGRNLLDTLKIYDNENNVINNKTYVSNTKGRFVYTVEVYDEIDDLYLRDQMIINVTDVVFSKKNNNYITLEVEDDNSLTIVQNGHNANSSKYDGDTELYQHYSIGAFNLSPSKLYYAEATIDTHETFGTGNTWDIDGNTLFGLAHVDSIETGRKQGNNFISSAVRGYCRSLVMNKYVNNEKLNPAKDDSSLTYIEDFVSTLKWNSKEFKIAIARNGELLYTFINDEYVASFHDNEYANKDTIPGIFSTSFNSSNIETRFRKVSFFDGSTASEKINTLLNGGKGLLIPNYKDTRNNQSKWEVFQNNDNGLGVNILTSDVTHSQSTFTNSVRYNSNFKIEWDFLPLEANVNSSEGGESSFVIQDYSNMNAKQIVSIHTRFNAKTLTMNRFAIQSDLIRSWGDQVVTDYDVSEGIHYEVTSTLEGEKRTFVFTATCIADNTVVNTRTIELENGMDIPGSTDKVEKMNGVFLFRFSTRNLKSTYSNIRFTGM